MEGYRSLRARTPDPAEAFCPKSLIADQRRLESFATAIRERVAKARALVVSDQLSFRKKRKRGNIGDLILLLQGG
jgi:hypothetical protein